MPIFYQKYVCSLKTHYSQGHILSKKRPFSKKKLRSHGIFSQIFNEKPSAANPIFDQKNVNSVKTTIYFGPKKSIGCLSFPIFHGNVTVLVPKLCRKTPPCCHAPIWSKKVHSIKTTLFHGRKKSKGCPLFPIFTNKLLLS